MASQLEEAGDLVGSVVLLDALLPEMMPSVQSAPKPSELFAQIGLAEVETESAPVTFAEVAAEIRRQTDMDFLTDTVLESVVGRWKSCHGSFGITGPDPIRAPWNCLWRSTICLSIVTWSKSGPNW
ncbi:hypothetical protein GCM10020255_087070 [Rhodococcus baikonurensis]